MCGANTIEKITLPDVMIRNLETYFGEDGLKWADDFHHSLQQVTKAWGLTLRKPFSNLSFNFVAPVLCPERGEAVLKFGFPHEAFANECHALHYFGGTSAVNIFQSDPSAGKMLLEYIKPGTSLQSVKDDDRATEIAAATMQSLWKNVEANHVFPSVRDWLGAFQSLRARFQGSTGPLCSHVFGLAEAVAAELLDSMGEPVLLHGDLHHDNIILARDRGWIVIDPKGVTGEREYEVGALLRNPDHEIYTKNFDRRIAILEAVLGFDRQRMIRWCFVQAVLSVVWSVNGGGNQWRPLMAWAESLSGLIN